MTLSFHCCGQTALLLLCLSLFFSFWSFFAFFHLNFFCLSVRCTPLSFLYPRFCCLCLSASTCHFRYFFPPLEPPREGARYGHLLPPSSLIEHCDAEPVQPPPPPQQQQALPRSHSSRALLSLPEAEGQ